jgi:alanyl-tRNA synthetase
VSFHSSHEAAAWAVLNARMPAARARAVRDALARRDVLAEVGRLLGVSPLDVGLPVARLQEAGRDAARAMSELRLELARHRAADWLATAETIGPCRVVLRDSGLDGAGLKLVAQGVVAGPGILAVLTGAGSPVPVIVARSADVAFDAGAFMKHAAARFGGRGGGRPELAQGGLTASPEAIRAFAREELEGREADREAGA